MRYKFLIVGTIFNNAKASTVTCICAAAPSLSDGDYATGWFCLYRKQLMYIVNTLLMILHTENNKVNSVNYHLFLSIVSFCMVSLVI